MRGSSGAGRAFSLISLIALVCGCGPAGDPAPAIAPDAPQNIVLIIIDTLRADKLSAYGFPLETSPELDSLAARGVLFSQTIAQSSWTRPSIGSLLTSRHPRSLGIYTEQRDVLARRFDTLAEILRAAGYQTFGTTANPNINTAFQFDQGFDRYMNSNVLFTWMDPEPGKKRLVKQSIQAAREMFDPLLEWVKEREGQGPFYLQTDIMEMHEWHDLRGRYERRGKSFAGQADSLYLEALRDVSREVGWFVHELSALPGFERTLFVITSDHGEGLFDHPSVVDSRFHGRLLYESNLRVPLIFYSTAGDLPAGRVVDRPVRLLDVMPTILDFAGVEAPAELDGVSLLPLLSEPPEPVLLPKQFYVETHYHGTDKAALYSQDWKYIENRDGQRGTALRALQPMGAAEDGPRTDRSSAEPQRTQQMSALLSAWERRHPRVEPTELEGELSDSDREQLRALGYGE